MSIPGYLAAVAVGVLLQGLVAHSVNEIADWRSGTDRDPAPRVISGGSKVIASGLLRPRDLALIGVAAAVAAAVIGLVAAATWGWVLLIYGHRRPRRRGALHAAAAAGGLPALQRRDGGLRLHLGVRHRRLRAPARRDLGRRRAHRDRLRGLVRGDADDAPLPGPRSRTAAPSPPRPRRSSSSGDPGAATRSLWAVIALAGAAALTALVDERFAILTAGFAAALVLHLVVDPDDATSVTRCELGVILVAMAGGLTTAAALAPVMTWALVAAVVLVPLELVLSGAAHRDLMTARARPRPAERGP